ncbi:hypothetical protein V2W45_1246495 [Cenococcum geophilum]
MFLLSSQQHSEVAIPESIGSEPGSPIRDDRLELQKQSTNDPEDADWPSTPLQQKGEEISNFLSPAQTFVADDASSYKKSSTFTSTHTHQQLSYSSYAQPAAPLPAQPPNQQKVRHIRTSIDGREDEALDPRYKRVSLRSQADFFCHGRVFMMLWIEPAELLNPGGTRGSTHFSVIKYGETAYSEIRRFVVVRNKGAFSQCVPVQTYRRQGATKVGVLVEDRAVIYTGGEHDPPPSLLEGEGITKQALRVVTDGNETLDVRSRINFGKTYTVEHNVKVLSIGTIAPEHCHLLEKYWKLAH